MHHAAATPRPFDVTHREVLRIALPMMLAYLSTPLVGVVATGVIAQLDDQVLVAGIALAAVIFDVLFQSCNFLRAASTGFTAQAIGAGDARAEQRMLGAGLVLALGLGLAALLLQGPIGRLALSALGAEGALRDAAESYYQWRIWSAPFVLLNFVIFGWVGGRGEALIALALQTALNGLTILAAIWLTLWRGQGVAGVAQASLLAEGVTCLAGLALVAWRTEARLWSRPDLATLGRMFSVNRDMLVRSFVLLMGMSFFTRQSAELGVAVLAANTVLLRYYFIGVAVLDGIAAAAEQLSGRAIGALWRPAFERMVALTTLWSLVLAGLVALAFWASAGWLIALVAPEPETAALAHRFLPYALAMPVCGAIAFQMDGIYIGATWSREMRNLMLGSVAVYLAAWAVLQPLFGNHGLWIALILFQSARSVAFRVWLPRLTAESFGARR